MRMADGSETPNFGDKILAGVREAICEETQGMTMIEAAAHFDITLVFTDVAGSNCRTARTDDNKHAIILNRNLRTVDQEKEFYNALTILTLADRHA
jgi:hypothetical protein